MLEESELRLIISRVELTLAASQVRLYEEISAVERSLAEVSRVSKELDSTQRQQEQLREMLVSVEKINGAQESEIQRLEKIMRTFGKYVFRLNAHTSILFIILVFVFLHVVGIM